MNQTTPTVAEVPWYRNGYVWLVIGFPAASVIAGLTTLAIAIKSYDGLVVDDYYRKGMQINQVVVRDREAERLSLSAALRRDPANPDWLELELNGNGEFNPPTELRVNFLHRTRSGFDQQALIPAVETNRYAGPVPPLVSGRWDVQVEADGWRLLETLTVK